MKKILFITILSLMSSFGFAQDNCCSATITIQPPVAYYGEIIAYCLEYCPSADVDSREAWEYVYIVPDVRYTWWNNSYEYTATSYVLLGLNPGTSYTVRVHAFYHHIDNDGNEYDTYGLYGTPKLFCTPLESADVFVDVNCGPLSPLGDEEHPENINAFMQQSGIINRYLYRPKEEWEQLS